MARTYACYWTEKHEQCNGIAYRSPVSGSVKACDCDCHEQEDTVSKQVTPEVISAIRRNLIEFGYDGLTDDEVREQTGLIMAGEDPADVIGMFARDMLRENGYLE